MFRCLAVAAAILFSAPGYADEAKYFKLVHKDTGKVLAVEDNSGDAGARIVLGKDDATTAQWKFEKDGGFYKVVNRKTGKVLDVFEDSREEGAAIIQWDEKSEGIDNQRWAWEGDGKARRLKAKSSDMVLDVDSDGKVIQKKADDKAKGQLWEVVEVKD
jgi:Ricin-type beta-trefoil lectin domain-like